MVQITDKHWAVEVPDDFEATQITEWTLYYKSFNRSYLIGLPPGDWQYLFTTKGCTEGDARKLVEQRGKSYRDYERTFNFIPLSVFTAIESLQSLLTSKGCDINKNWAIILKQTDNGIPQDE